MKHFIIYTMLLLSSIVIGQNCQLKFTGKVIDFHNGEPIVGATIHVKTLDTYTTSDINGVFNIEQLCKGPLVLIVSHVSCETKTISVELTKNMNEIVYLEHHVEALETVVLKGQQDSHKALTAQKAVLKQSTIEANSSESLGTVLKQLGGITSINTGNKIVKPVINGLHSSRITIMNNNVRMEEQEWGMEHAPNIDINSAQSIAVIKGSSALAYSGDAIGGIVILKPKQFIKKDTLFGKTIAGFQSNGLAYNITSALTKNFESGWFANAVAGYKQNGDLRAPDYYLNNTGARSIASSLLGGYKSFEKGFEAYISYVDNTIGILSASHIGNTADLVNAINSDVPMMSDGFSGSIEAPKQEVSHLLAKINAYKRFSAFGKLDVQYDYQNNHRLEFDIRRGDDKDKPAVDLKLQTHSLKSDVTIDKLENYTIHFGLSGRYQDNFANPDTEVRRLIPDYERYDFGAYAIVKSELSQTLSADLGIRYDYNHVDAFKYYRTNSWEEKNYDLDFSDIIIEDLGTQLLANPKFTFHNISVSTGLLYHLNTTNTLSFNYGLSSRPPNPSELFSDGLHHSAARIEVGDLRIDKEIANRFGLTYKLDTNNLSFNIDTYANFIDNFIYLRPTGEDSTIRGSFPVWEYFQTDAQLFGADLNIDYQISEPWKFTTSLSYVYGKNIKDDLAIIDIPSFRTNSALTFYYKKWKDLNVSLAHEFVDKQVRYPNYNFEAYIATTDSYELVDISTPPGAYNLFNMSADATFALSKTVDFNLMIGVQNIFDTAYREYLNRLRYFADDTGRNITVQVKFNY